MSKKQRRLISAITAILIFMLFSLHDRCLSGMRKHDAKTVRVVEVHDGDTVSVTINKKTERVRLIGIDAPELGQRPWGNKSKKHLESILSASGWDVTIEPDIDKRDKYGRLLAYLWTKDGQLINLRMLEDGYAMLYTFPPNVRYVDILSAGQKSARDNKLGIWGWNGLRKTPQEYRKAHPR